ncbi:MAG: NHL repeat-containing protein [Candidatus Rokubacteria bacterium]|nr:NHL repeat-containing protein [Candidatus Rokubacteria bacterium]
MRHASLALYRWVLFLVPLEVVLAAAGPALAAPPPNDNFADATVIAALPFTETIDTRDATIEADEQTFCGAGIAQRTIWYEFTPATAVSIEASTVGSSTATAITLYTGPRALQFLDFVDCTAPPFGPFLFSPRLVHDLMPGVTYFFQIRAAGTVVFSLAPAPPPPAHDDFDQAIVIGGLPFSDTVDTASATRALDDPLVCGETPSGTVWYTFTPPEDMLVIAETSRSDYTAEIEVLTGSRGALTSFGCRFNSVSAQLTGGVTYHFMVESICDPFFGICLNGGTLRFSLDGGQPPREAVKVFGQPDFFTNFPNIGGRSASSLNAPTGVAVDASGDHLYVADRGNHRILEYQDPVTGDVVADHLFGQPDFATGTANTGGISASSLNFPTELTIDASGSLYVADFNNNRVLRYDNPLGTDAVADLVIGQPNFTTGTANTGGLSASSLRGPSGVAVDAGGSLYLGEFTNNRVLRFDSPLVNNDIAGLVLGQPDFTTSTCNTGGLNASSLCIATDVMLDGGGNLYVSDTGNGRVLKFGPPLTSNQPAADLVIGQPDFTTTRNPDVCNGVGVSASTLCDPRGLAVDCAGNFYVADLTHNRVLVFKDPLRTDTVADEVLGQINFRLITANWEGVSARTLRGPRGVAVDDEGNLYVADSGNNRVLMFEIDQDFDGVSGSQEACPCEAPSLGLDADQNGCTDTIAGLKTIVQGLSIDSKLKNGLLGKLDEAQKALDRGSTLVAVNKLRDFIDQVEGQRGKGISASDADLLVVYANNLIVLISP